MEYNRSEWAEDSLSKEDQLEQQVQIVKDVQVILGDYVDHLSNVANVLDLIAGKVIPHGAKFIILYYLDMLPSKIVNQTAYGKIFKKLLGNGNYEDYRKWLIYFKSQIGQIKKAISERNYEFEEDQPSTFKNFSIACQVFQDHNLQNDIKEPFEIRDFLESLK